MWETFVNQEFREGMEKSADDFYAAHVKALTGINHIVAKAGAKLPLSGVDLQILASAGKTD